MSFGARMRLYRHIVFKSALSDHSSVDAVFQTWEEKSGPALQPRGGRADSGWTLCLPVPIWNLIYAGDWRNDEFSGQDCEGWMFPVFWGYEGPRGKKWGFYWHRWRVEYSEPAPDIPRV